ncbi:MAG: protein kinase [Planctomycetota bacterium]
MSKNAMRDDWALIQHLFETALELPTEEVHDFLSEACLGKDDVRIEVEQLLDAFQGGKDELESSPLQDPSRSPRLPKLDGYEMLTEIHYGGQGTVYRAIQLSTKREVALKLMNAGQFAGETTKRRFGREVELAGSLRHPGIVPIFDSGLARDQYFYAMEYVDGVHLDRYVREASLTKREILCLFVEICDAVNHAQQRGVVHRDLKPSNILVDSRGKPRVLDFGLAKLMNADIDQRVTASMTGEVLGTLAYMSPEQASGSNDAIDTRTDVYTLGVVMFELLTGELPYDLDFSLAENLSTIKRSEPDERVLRRHRIDGEVSTILLKALQKEKERRYGSAGAMGDDLSRYLRGEAIEAKRDSALYLIRKVLRRNVKSALAAAAFLLLIVSTSIVSLILFLAADEARYQADRNASLYRSQRDEASRLRDEGLHQLYVAEMNLAGQNFEKAGGIKRVKQLTKKWADSQLEHEVRDWEWYYLQSQCDRESEILEHPCRIWCLDWHPKRVEIAFGDDKGHVWTWRPGEEPRWIGKVGNQIRSVAWNCDGTCIAAACPSNDVVAWRDRDRKEIARVKDEKGSLAIAWHPSDPNRFAFSNTKKALGIWDASINQRVARWETNSQIQAIQWTNDGEEIVAACHNRSIQIWNIKKQRAVERFEGFNAPVFGASLRPGRPLIAACDVRGRISLISRQTKKRVWSLQTERMMTSVQWSPAGNSFASVGSDRVLRVFSDQGTLLARFNGHLNVIWGLDWSPDGAMIATAGLDKTIRLWDLASADRDRVVRTNPESPSSPIESVSWHPTGDTIAAFGGANSKYFLRSSDLAIVQKIKPGPGGSEIARWSPSGDRIASGGLHKQVRVLDASTGKVTRLFDRHAIGSGSDRVHDLSWNSNGDRLVSSSHRGDVFVWDSQTGEVFAEHHEPWFASSVDWHPTESLIAIACSSDHTIKLWHFESDDPPETVIQFESPIRSVRWSPNGVDFAACGDDGEIQIWDTVMRRMKHRLSDHTSSVACLAWNPSGTRIASGGDDLTIRLWDTEHGVQTLAFRAHDQAVTSIDWSPDGKQLVSAGLDSMVKVWDASKGYERSRTTGGGYRARAQTHQASPRVQPVSK